MLRSAPPPHPKVHNGEPQELVAAPQRGACKSQGELGGHTGVWGPTGSVLGTHNRCLRSNRGGVGLGARVVGGDRKLQRGAVGSGEESILLRALAARVWGGFRF